MLTVCGLRDALFARRFKSPHGGRPGDWQRPPAGLLAADSARTVLPGGATARLFALWQEPGDRADLDDPVVLEVRIPTGAHFGALVDAETVGKLGRMSAPKLRAYIGAASANWLPGKTRVPNPRSRRFGWTGDPDAYPVFTAQDRRDVAFGVGDTKNRTRTALDAPFVDLPGVEVIDRNAQDPRTGVRGWRIVPSEAAEAVRRWRDRMRRKRRK